MNMEEATDTAREFARKNGYVYTRLDSVELVGEKWIVILRPTVIILEPKKVKPIKLKLRIVINDKNSEILNFEKIKAK